MSLQWQMKANSNEPFNPWPVVKYQFCSRAQRFVSNVYLALVAKRKCHAFDVQGVEIGNDDVFIINKEFKHKLYRIRINQVQLKETVSHSF
jgi:hypothetical protein